jgi:hypothetical protein
MILWSRMVTAIGSAFERAMPESGDADLQVQPRLNLVYQPRLPLVITQAVPFPINGEASFATNTVLQTSNSAANTLTVANIRRGIWEIEVTGCIAMQRTGTTLVTGSSFVRVTSPSSAVTFDIHNFAYQTGIFTFRGKSIYHFIEDVNLSQSAFTSGLNEYVVLSCTYVANRLG